MLTVDHRCYAISRFAETIPKNLSLATVRISHGEQQNWNSNLQYEWAKKYYPADLLDRVNFRARPKEMSAAVVTEPKPK